MMKSFTFVPFFYDMWGFLVIYLGRWTCKVSEFVKQSSMGLELYKTDNTREEMRWDQWAANLGQVQVGLGQQVGVIFGHQADDIIKHPVLLVHGDSEVRLLDCGKEPIYIHTETHTAINNQAPSVFFLMLNLQNVAQHLKERNAETNESENRV